MEANVTLVKTHPHRAISVFRMACVQILGHYALLLMTQTAWQY